MDSKRARWAARTYVTEDTEIIAAKAKVKALQATADCAKQERRFAATTGVDLAMVRKLQLLCLPQRPTPTTRPS